MRRYRACCLWAVLPFIAPAAALAAGPWDSAREPKEFRGLAFKDEAGADRILYFHSDVQTDKKTFSAALPLFKLTIEGDKAAQLTAGAKEFTFTSEPTDYTLYIDTPNKRKVVMKTGVEKPVLDITEALDIKDIAAREGLAGATKITVKAPASPTGTPQPPPTAGLDDFDKAVISAMTAEQVKAAQNKCKTPDLSAPSQENAACVKGQIQAALAAYTTATLKDDELHPIEAALLGQSEKGKAFLQQFAAADAATKKQMIPGVRQATKDLANAYAVADSDRAAAANKIQFNKLRERLDYMATARDKRDIEKGFGERGAGEDLDDGNAVDGEAGEGRRPGETEQQYQERREGKVGTHGRGGNGVVGPPVAIKTKVEEEKKTNPYKDVIFGAKMGIWAAVIGFIFGGPVGLAVMGMVGMAAGYYMSTYK